MKLKILFIVLITLTLILAGCDTMEKNDSLVLDVPVTNEEGVETAIPIINVTNNNNSENEHSIYTSIVGLPVDNYNLGGMIHVPLAEGPSYRDWYNFFIPGNFDLPQTFAFVRVVETHREEQGWHSMQTSSLENLSVLWSRDYMAPETFSIKQLQFGGCCLNEPTNLLRKGGVYLLPLRYSQHYDSWRLMGDIDVLFEIDDQGRVWSHSEYEPFNRFDGERISILADFITTLTSDENYPAASTQFGRYARSSILVETTILSTAPRLLSDQWSTQDAYQYTLRADKIISTSSVRTWQPKIGEVFDAISYAEDLEYGGRYLVFSGYGSAGLGLWYIAKINDDGTITAITSHNNVFAEFNDYTVEQMAELAQRAKAWFESYANQG